MRKIFDGTKNPPHPERDPERSEGEQSKDATPVIQFSSKI